MNQTHELLHLWDMLNTARAKTCSKANSLKEVWAELQQWKCHVVRQWWNLSSLLCCHLSTGQVERFWLNRLQNCLNANNEVSLVWGRRGVIRSWVSESYLFAFLQQQLQSVIGSFGHHFIPLCFILTLGVVHVDAEVECYIHQGCHQLHGCQKQKCHWEIQSNPSNITGWFTTNGWH